MSEITTSTSTTTRKRNNSIIPYEFRNDTSDGGMERAALATVFGVREYTESKIFWNSEEDYYDDNSATTSTKPVQRSLSKRSYTSSSSRHVQPSTNKILPIIPAVSEFGDIWSQVNPTTTTTTDMNNKQQHTQELTNNTSKVEYNSNSFQISPPADLSDYPLTLFDLIKSDENPNFILWGTIQKTNNTIPPTAPKQQDETEEDDTKKKKSRWSAHQFISDSFKKKSPTFYNNSLPIMLSTAEESRVIEAATIEKLVEKLTISLDYTFMTDFFLIFRVFMSPLQLCKFLITRFRWSIENNEEERCIVRIRTFVVMRHWLLNYFLHDFIPSRELRIALTSFLNAMPYHPLIKQSPRDQRIIKGLKRVVRRLKKIYYASSSSGKKVQVIQPPPPTFEQEKVMAMVKDKLAQSTIKQKTFNIVDGIHVDTRHSSNTAIKSARAAPVVVIGNYPTRRRGSSASSAHLSKSHENESTSASLEWAKISHPSDYSQRNLSDNSLESALSPGTSEDEEDDLSEFDEDETQKSFSSKPTASTNQITSDELSEKLERLRQQQEEDDERNRAEFFLSAYRDNPSSITAGGSLHQSNWSDNGDVRTRSFYNAQLAIPSTVSTPDIYYPTAVISYFDTDENNLIASTSYNSMAYPSVTESEIVTPSNDCLQQQQRYHFLSHHPEDKTLLSQRSSKILYDPKKKPLPSLNDPMITSCSSIASYAKSKQLPRTPSIRNEEDGAESWRLSIHSSHKQQTASCTSELRRTDSNLTENTSHTPRSRILEIDISHNHHPTPPLPLYIKAQERKSIVLSYSTSVMAEQFCLIEKAILLAVNWEELVDCKWTKMPSSTLYHPNSDISHLQSASSSVNDDSSGGPVSSGTQPPQPGMYSRQKRMKQQEEKDTDGSQRGIEKVINRFNAVCQWVSSEIVQTRQMDDRVKLIEKFIRLAKKCKNICNFTTLIQILLGLQSSSVSRLEKTWSLVKKREMKILQELSTFTSPTKNWKNIRDSMTKVAEEYGESPTEIQVQVPETNKKKKKKPGVTIKLPFGGCIPFLGIYLSDLVFNAELPSYLPSTNNNIRTKRQGTMDQLLSQPLIHFRKHRITATVIKRVLVFQNLAKRYSFDESGDALLYSSCFQVTSLDPDTINKLSYDIEL